MKEVRVLVVSNTASLRSAICTMICHRANYTTIMVGNGQHALQILASEGAFDLLITSLELPGDIDGFELVCQLRANPPTRRIKVIMVGNVQREQKYPTACMSIESIIALPLDPAVLEETIRGMFHDVPTG